MGQTLAKPVTTKDTASCANSQYKVGSSSMQGWRINMEDAHIHLLSLPDDKEAAFFAVYDGHGGSKFSQFASMHLHKHIVNHPSYSKGNFKDAMKHGFINMDKQMFDYEEMKAETSGTTASVILIKNSTIYCGNVGDSRTVISLNGRACPLSFDHKPDCDNELKRIGDAGGYVECNRVNGSLALTRALGDYKFKTNSNLSAEKQIVTADPDVTVTKITPELEFVLLACDGIWEVFSNQEAIDFCRDGLIAGLEPEKICENLLDCCLSPDSELSGAGCDNMTAVLVVLLQNKTPEEYQQLLISRGKFVDLTDDKAQTDLKITVDCVDEHFLTPSQSPCSDDTTNFNTSKAATSKPSPQKNDDKIDEISKKK